MNCARCNTLLPQDARFCRVCGLPIPTPAPTNMVGNPPQYDQPATGNTPAPGSPMAPWSQPQPPQQPQTLQPGSTPAQSQWGEQQWAQQQPVQPQWAQQQPQQWEAQTQAAPPVSPWPQSYQPSMAASPPPGTMQSVGNQPATPPVRARRRIGCLPRILIALLVVAALLVGGWFLALRPFLHAQAQNQIDQVLTTAINQIIPLPPQLPPQFATLPITETLINNLITLNTAPSDPVQHMHMTITTQGLQIDFQVYGFSCSVSAQLVASNGNPLVTNVSIQGIVALVMSADELTTIINSHLSDVQAHLHHAITTVTLKDQEVDLTLNPTFTF